MRTPFATSLAEFEAFIGPFLQRWEYVRPDNAAAFADKLMRFLRASDLPRDPFATLPLVGVELRAEHLPAGQKAQAFEQGGRMVFVYSRRLGMRRADLTFPLWHEFAETLFSHRAFPTTYRPRPEARMANLLAANILMPQEAMVELVRRYRRNRTHLPTLIARDCFTSITAVCRRLAELGLAGRPLTPGTTRSPLALSLPNGSKGRPPSGAGRGSSGRGPTAPARSARELDRQLDRINADPRFQWGMQRLAPHRPLSADSKRFIVELYRQLMGPPDSGG